MGVWRSCDACDDGRPMAANCRPDHQLVPYSYPAALLQPSHSDAATRDPATTAVERCNALTAMHLSQRVLHRSRGF